MLEAVERGPPDAALVLGHQAQCGLDGETRRSAGGGQSEQAVDILGQQGQHVAELAATAERAAIDWKSSTRKSRPSRNGGSPSRRS